MHRVSLNNREPIGSIQGPAWLLGKVFLQAAGNLTEATMPALGSDFDFASAHCRFRHGFPF